MKTEGSGGEHFEELFLAHYSRVVTVLQRVVGDFASLSGDNLLNAMIGLGREARFGAAVA